ncbi:2',3'-cyclic-nucleotide 2'-phosphodiesterase [Gracilibacillus halophilus YIM-C55.5]|uniref:2',3'-cyclic-nucleotide 2'-phosphodiesterase n=1 Tax=Gracilibacillus halophilus YIM-C55.5 TaxID=1308866 RepID=N4WBN6_9BACI|nr:bifunctional UDP-sugar hydrolase/5'-nucleotidase [Gracilibacillus halophilus]ENH97708.1 2',3'-cyclic-nucleotide 2'-phosphodiesterase [Gracilibacillus halophilus YIM-C55.5]
MSTSLSICFTSDVHGYVHPTNYRDSTEQPLGLAKLATIIEQIKEQKHMLLIDNGDFIQGSPFTYYYAKQYPETPSPMIQVANTMGYDVGILGNHEFNYGISYLNHAIEASQYPWLSANILDKQTKEPYFEPYVIREIKGLKIGFIGLTTHLIPQWEDPSHIESLVFEDACKAAKRWVPYVRKQERPDFLVVCYHGGLERDPETKEATEPITGENQAVQICQEVDGIDLLLTGHQHRLLVNQVKETPLIQVGHQGAALGEIEVTFDQNKAVTSVRPMIHEVEETTNTSEAVLNDMEDKEKTVQDWLDQPMARTRGDMTIDDAFQARLTEHPFIEYINQLQMKVSGASISCTAIFDNQAPGFPENISMRDVVTNYIFPNTLKVIKLRGRDIKEALERTAHYFQVKENGEMGIHPEFLYPKPQHYNYDMWEGIEYTINVSKPVGQRVVQLDYNERPMDMEEEFAVVMNHYRASGGGGYEMFSGKEVLQDIQTDMTEIIANDLLQEQIIEASCNQNWKVVYE